MPIEHSVELLAALHPEANDPHEPYNGVQALFGGDLHSYDPGWAPRERWLVLSPYEIVYIGLGNVSMKSLLGNDA